MGDFRKEWFLFTLYLPGRLKGALEEVRKHVKEKGNDPMPNPMPSTKAIIDKLILILNLLPATRCLPDLIFKPCGQNDKQ